MSSTPPKKDGVEPPQSPDDDQHMDRTAEDTQAQGLGYEFEVKEQDRWLPIANGAYCALPPAPVVLISPHLLPACTSLDCSPGVAGRLSACPSA